MSKHIIRELKKIWRPLPILTALMGLSIIVGAILFISFRIKSNDYIDRATAHYVHELIKMADIPFEDHFDNAVQNLQFIDGYITYYHPDRRFEHHHVQTSFNYFKEIGKAEDILFLKESGQWSSLSGLEGDFENDDELALMFSGDIPRVHHMVWTETGPKYIIAIPTQSYWIDDSEYQSLVFLFKPDVLNTFQAIHSYSGEARLYVMDEAGNLFFTNDATCSYENHLTDYLDQGIMSQATVDSILTNFHTGHHDWTIIQKNGLETFFCYHAGGPNEYSIAMEVPAINARSILTTLKSMLVWASTAIAGLMALFLLALCIFITLSFHNKSLAMNEKKVSLAKSTFLSNMSHDIRTPMNAIIGYTTLALAAGNKTKTVKEYLGKIKSSSTHLLSLINDILEMSRIESGKVQIDLTPISIQTMLSDIDNIVRADVDIHGHQFTIDSSAVTHNNILCDRLRIRQVILNLLSNAIKYTPDGGCITLTVKESESGLAGSARYSISIKDNGMGMSDEFAKTVFEQFTRERNSTVSGIQGTGLGMAIVKNLVDLMGGSIEMHTKQNVGTEIILSFDFHIEESCESETKHEIKTYNFEGKKILLVEDNELNREIATAILEDTGCIITTANDGSQAVEAARNAKDGDIDIILMDIQMPVMNGFEATRLIRGLGTPIANIPIIAMTANAFEEDREAAIKAGMNEHVGKPIDVDNLKTVMARFL